MQTATVKQMFKDMGYEFEIMPIGVFQDVSDKQFKIKTLDSSGTEVWKLITKIVRKPSALKMEVRTTNNKLFCSPDHKVLVKNNQTNASFYEEIAVLLGNESSFKIRSKQGWEEFYIVQHKDNLPIADFEVEEEHSYLSDGLMSHNTIYGDPTTVPGGKALPYNASIRIKLGGGAQIKKTVDGEERVIGVSVTANIIKNRMSAPFRKVDFEIHFGKGIREHEQVFDYLRTWCDKHQDTPAKLGDVKITISGTGAWKELNLSNIVTGEVLDTVKFYKADFANILYNPKYKKEMTALMDAAYLWTSDEEEHLTLGEVLPEEAIEDPLTIST